MRFEKHKSCGLPLGYTVFNVGVIVDVVCFLSSIGWRVGASGTGDFTLAA